MNPMRMMASNRSSMSNPFENSHINPGLIGKHPTSIEATEQSNGWGLPGLLIRVRTLAIRNISRPPVIPDMDELSEAMKAIFFIFQST